MNTRDASATFVVDEGDLRKYRTETPNMVLDMGLDPYTLSVYTHIKRIAGDRGVCDAGVRTLAKLACMSPGQVSKSLKILREKGLIRVKTHPRESGLADEIYAVNVWRRNFEHFDSSEASAVADGGGRREADRGPEIEPAGPRSSDEHPPVHVVNTAQTACSCHEHPRSCGEHKKEPLSSLKETSPDGDAKKPEPTSSSRSRMTVSKLSQDEAERRWNALCHEDPHGDSLRRMAELLAAERAKGRVAVTTVWGTLGERYQRARKQGTLTEEAWTHGFDRAIANAVPNINWVLKAAKGYVPEWRSTNADKGVDDGADRTSHEDVTEDYEFLFARG